MKTLVTLFVLLFAFTNATSISILEKFEGTYNGLTDDMEYQFTDKTGKVYFFNEIDEDIEYDLSDEEYVGQKFVVTWEEKNVEVYDENEELTVIKVRVITGLKKL